VGDQEPEIVIARDLDDLHRQAAEFVTRYIMNRARPGNRVAIALSGGTTPRGLYERLAGENLRHKIPWSRVHLFWGDERCVPPENPESNYRTADESLISRVPIPLENIHRMPGEKTDPQKAADAYERTLRDFFRTAPGEWPAFDLALLGVGSDGHTASLFPGSPVLEETRRWVAAPYVEKLKAHRLTLTLPVFNHADQVIFLAAGREKAPVMREWVSQENRTARFPFEMIRPLSGRLLFLLDREAAGSMNPSERKP